MVLLRVFWLLMIRISSVQNQDHPTIKIKCILADALYGTANFMDKASAIFGNIQVISQLRKNQNIRFRTKEMNLETYFSKFPGTSQKIKIRGDEEITVIVGSARLHVCAHGKKRFVVALKYEGEDEYRYLVASDLSWRTLDIAQAYTLRWLVEVFFEDWKSYEGWGQLAKQPDEDGSRRSLILSLLLDHCLLFHPEQKARLENKLPAATVGSLREKIKAESMVQVIQELVSSENPRQKIKLFVKRVEEVFKLNDSKKHMNGLDLGRLESTPSLKHRARVVAASLA